MIVERELAARPELTPEEAEKRRLWREKMAASLTPESHRKAAATRAANRETAQAGKKKTAKSRAQETEAKVQALAAGPTTEPLVEAEMARLRAELVETRARLDAALAEKEVPAPEAVASEAPEKPSPRTAAAPKPSAKEQPPDPDREVAEEVARVLGTAQAPPPPPTTHYVDDGDPTREAEMLAIKMLQDEAARRAEARKNRAKDPRVDLARERDMGRSPIELMVDAPDDVNPFPFEDANTGEDLREAGYVYRWTRLKDDFDQRRDNPQRLRQRMAWGAEVVVQPSDGKQLRTDTMIATRIPVKREAQRKIALADPGTFDNARALAAREHERLAVIADDENVAYSKRYHGGGKGVVHLTPSPQSQAWYGRADEGDDE